MARTCILRVLGLQMPWRFSSGVKFVLFCFVFRLYAFVETATLHSIVLRYAGDPISTRVFFFPPFFVYLKDVAFSEYFFRFLFVWRVRRTFFPPGWCFFYLVTTGWIFYISLCENSINQSINKGLSWVRAFNILDTRRSLLRRHFDCKEGTRPSGR